MSQISLFYCSHKNALVFSSFANKEKPKKTIVLLSQLKGKMRLPRMETILRQMLLLNISIK